MVFSTPLFLFLFLPIVLALYAICPARGRNLLLLLASLLFYAWGALKLTPIMLASICGNWLFGIWIARLRGSRWASLAMALVVAVNLSGLAYFKYMKFLMELTSDLLAQFGIPQWPVPDIILPIGISFFTFHAMSYVVDVYRGDAPVQRNPINLALYLAMFPQLVAGPIIRYHDVASQLTERRVTLAGFSEGVERFLWGLGKKILIANSVAPVADAVFGMPSHELTMPLAWLGVICYALQIYFDFSGYSDMAIGLGLMFGFRFMENFNYPYVARSITEFWRRWHISLSTWFRDYLYIPLGGNRAGPARTYLNLMIVFFLCGLWHGASWNFIVWGMFHGSLLILERAGLSNWLARRAAVGHVYTVLAFLVGWVFFRAPDLPHAFGLLSALCGVVPGGSTVDVRMYLDPSLWCVLLAGVLLSLPLVPQAIQNAAQWARGRVHEPALAVLVEGSLGLGRVAALAGCLLACAIALSATTYNPFIYYQF